VARRPTSASTSHVTRRRSAAIRSCCPACLHCSSPVVALAVTSTTTTTWKDFKQSTTTGTRATTTGTRAARGSWRGACSVSQEADTVDQHVDATTKTRRAEDIELIVDRRSSGFLHCRKPRRHTTWRSVTLMCGALEEHLLTQLLIHGDAHSPKLKSQTSAQILLIIDRIAVLRTQMRQCYKPNSVVCPHYF